MGARHVFLIFTVGALHVGCQPVENSQGVGRSSLFFIQATPQKTQDADTVPDEDLDDGGLVSFLTLLLLSSLPESAGQIQGNADEGLQLEGNHHGFPTFANESLATASMEESEEERQLLLAMALRKLFGDSFDSSESEELDAELQEGLWNLKMSLSDPVILEKSQEMLAQLIQPKEVEASPKAEVSEIKASPAVETSPEVKTSPTVDTSSDVKAPSKVKDSIAVEALAKVKTADEDLNTIAYQDEDNVTKFESLTKKNDKTKTEAHREEHKATKFKHSSKEAKDSDSFAHRNEAEIKTSRLSSEEDSDRDSFAYRDENGKRILNPPTDKDSDEVSEVSAEKDSNVSAEKDDDDDKEDLFAYRDDMGHILARFPGF